MPRTILSAKTDAARDMAVRIKAQAYALHGGLDGMARAAGMSRSTIYARIKDLPSCCRQGDRGHRQGGAHPQGRAVRRVGEGLLRRWRA